MSERFVVVSGCSGGGKSTLLAELAARGHAIVEEPGRRIVREELASGGAALPWVDMAAFARRAVEVSFADRAAAAMHKGWVFFDRGLIDAASALEHATRELVLEEVGREHRYYPRVFMAPPWPEIYTADAERQHGLDVAVEEYERLLKAYAALGYELVLLPKTSVAERAEFLLAALAHQA